MNLKPHIIQDKYQITKCIRQSWSIFHRDAYYCQLLKCSRLCMIVFTVRIENSIYGVEWKCWVCLTGKISVCNHAWLILCWISLIFYPTEWKHLKHYVFAADSVFELDSSTESAEASPEVNHRVRRSGVMARRGTPSR